MEASDGDDAFYDDNFFNDLMNEGDKKLSPAEHPLEIDENTNSVPFALKSLSSEKEPSPEEIALREKVEKSNHNTLKPIIDIIQLPENSNMELSRDFQSIMRSKGQSPSLLTPEKKRNSGYVFGPNSVYGRNAAMNEKG